MSLSRGRALRWSLSALAAAVASVVTIAGSGLLAPGAAGAAGAPNAQLTLVSQSQWVTPTQTDGTATFTLGLKAAGAPAGSKVTVSLYDRLVTRSAFEADLRSAPSQSQARDHTAPVTLDQLPTGPQGTAELRVTVVPNSSAAGGAPPSPSLDLTCTYANASCGGVYPVVVSLESPSGSELDHFTSFLTYASPSTAKLNFAWVVPLEVPTSIRGDAAQPSNALVPLAPTTAAGLAQLVGELHSTDVPVTLQPAAQTVQALRKSGTKGIAAITTLKLLSGDPSVDQVVANGYVPIDLGALAAAGEPTEISAQVQAGVGTLSTLGITSAATTWITTGRVGSSIGPGLAQVGATHVVVPDTQLAPVTTTNTWASTFQLSLGGTPTPAAASDGVLTSQFTPHGDPALAATRLLADLAMVHFELPYTGRRGLIAVPPPKWRPTPAFDTTLLKGLQDNPVVQPVTLSRFFSTVSQSKTSRRLSSTGPTLSRSLAHQISTARLRLTAFDSAVTRRTAVPTQLGQALLTAEASYRGPRGMAAQVSAFRRLFDHQLSLVQLSSTDNSITLTARTGRIPITVVSNAPYTVRGVLRLSSSKFKFPQGSTRNLLLAHPTNSVDVPVVARTLGDSPVTVSFTTPGGGLAFAHSQVTVRSTATSVVGVVLTAAALAILLGWWARTWWRGRRRRRTAAGAGRHA